jgi:predicted amidohydrolase
MRPNPFRAAAIQFEPTQFDKRRNIEGLSALIAQAAADGAKLIVTPEMGTTGYCWFDRAEVAPFVEPVPGPTTAHFAGIARALDCHIVIGMPEVDPETGLYYNTAVLIGPDGIIGRHRKTHPYISEPKWAVSGDLGHQVFDTALGRIALLICMDIHFLETARLAAVQNVDIICHISNWLAERTPAPYWISRAFENGCFLIESNRWGLERGVQFSGGSCVIEPDGSLAAVVDNGDGIAAAVIDPSKVRRLSGRRPDLYAELMTNTFAWTPGDFFGLYGKNPWPPGRRSLMSVAQFRASETVEDNLRRIDGFAAAAHQAGASLLVTPERSLVQAAAAQPVEGEAVDGLCAIAARYKLHIVAGMAEADGPSRYNTAVLVGPEGVVGRYRKNHLSAADRDWATAGSGWAVFDLPIGRLGLLVGDDLLYPESGRILSLLGCDIVACPAALPGRLSFGHRGTGVAQSYPIPTGADPHHWHHARVRAGENNVYLGFANAIDPDHDIHGKSGVFGPDNFAFPRVEAIVWAGEGLATSEIDTTNLDTRYPTNVVRRKDLVTMRLPHHYRDLIKGN